MTSEATNPDEILNADGEGATSTDAPDTASGESADRRADPLIIEPIDRWRRTSPIGLRSTIRQAGDAPGIADGFTLEGTIVTAADSPDEAHRRPDGVSNATVEALGKLSEALEVVEHARGLLYGFHRLTGKADLALGAAVELMRAAGHADIADRLNAIIVGRNVIDGRWTFQIVEDYDENYYSAFVDEERAARQSLVGGKRHLFEAEMKEARRTHDMPHHEARPTSRP